MPQKALDIETGSERSFFYEAWTPVEPEKAPSGKYEFYQISGAIQGNLAAHSFQKGEDGTLVLQTPSYRF